MSESNLESNENLKNSILGPFLVLFAYFRAKKIFSRKSTSVALLFLNFYCYAAKTILLNRLGEKLVTNRPDGRSHGRTHKEA